MSNAGDVVIENAGEGRDRIEADLPGGRVPTISTFSLAALPNVEELVYTGPLRFVGTGNDADNLIVGGPQNDTLTGGLGKDTLDGGAGGADSLVGGAGDDYYIVDLATDKVVELAGEGNDTVLTRLATWSLASTANVENVVFIGTGDALLSGNALANALTGGVGNDTLDGGKGADTLVGGKGDDVYFVDNPGDQVSEAANEGTDTVRASITWTLGDNLENLTLTTGSVSGTGNALDNAITGSSGNNLLSGLLGNDTLIGLAGNDTLDGGVGADSLVGGDGNDVYVIDDAGDSVSEFAGGGTDTVRTGLGTIALSFQFAEIENVIATSAAAFTATGNLYNNILTGNVGDDQLFGLGGADTLNGAAGNDTLDGGTGADSLVGGLGDDVYRIDDLGDIIKENAGEGADTVITTLTAYTLAKNVETLLSSGTGDFALTGNSLANRVVTGAGSDTLDGGAGADTLEGRLGDDVYFVDNIGDMLIDTGGNDTVVSKISWSLAPDFETLRLGGISSINGTGNDGANTLWGNAGKNVLDGGLGADTLHGGAGDDTYIVDNTGDRTIEVEAGVDQGGIDTVKTALAQWTLDDGIEKLLYTGLSAFHGTGNALANMLTGGTGDDLLEGLAGNDSLLGGAGNDTLSGGTGADVLTGGLGADTFVLTKGASDGDSITDFKAATASVPVGDTLLLTGWGAGTTIAAAVGQPGYWTITDGVDHSTELVKIAGTLHPTDVFFG